MEEEEDKDIVMLEEEDEPDDCDQSLDTIEHTDSYHLQLQRTRDEAQGEGDLEIVDAEDSLTNFDLDQDVKPQSETNTNILKDSGCLLEEESAPTADGKEDNAIIERESGSVAELLVAERSTASDVVSQAMMKAAERAAAPVQDDGSVDELLVAERSTASDVVSQAMLKAVERAATPVQDY